VRESGKTLECFCKLIIWMREWVEESIYRCEGKEQVGIKITLKPWVWIVSHYSWIDIV